MIMAQWWCLVLAPSIPLMKSNKLVSCSFDSLVDVVSFFLINFSISQISQIKFKITMMTRCSMDELETVSVVTVTVRTW